jgi:hypothetical protein
MFPHRNIHKCTWTSPDGNTHNQIDYILIDRWKHSSVLNVWSFRAADCDMNHCLVVLRLKTDKKWINKEPQISYEEDQSQEVKRAKEQREVSRLCRK